MTIEVGISGWTYDGWRGNFYPPQLAHRKELAFASRKLPTIEINGTFYSLQKPTSFERWRRETPANFVFSVKANRYITHVKRLSEISAPVANFLGSGVLLLREKLGPILWQFPPSLRFDPEKFEAFLGTLPHCTSEALRFIQTHGDLAPERRADFPAEEFSLRHAVEVRHESFLNPWFVDLLRAHGVALVFADTAGKWPYMEDVTADFVYLRLHGDEELYVSGYGKEALRFWANRIDYWARGLEPPDRLTISDLPAPRRKRDVFVYFDNDAKVRAPVDAKTLLSTLSPGLLKH